MSHHAALELRRAGYMSFYGEMLETVTLMLVRHGIEEGNAVAAAQSWLDIGDTNRLLDLVKDKYTEDA
ncbi:MAG: hypothetical protein WC069_06555 [Candidatus Shapirobacteria bacterium]